MKIAAFQITSSKIIPFHTDASTLDEMTRELPQGFYTTFNTLSQGTKVLGLHAHLQRLYAPAMEQGIDPSVDEPTLRTRIAELGALYLPRESRLRLILIKESGRIYIGTQPFEPPSKSVYAAGVKVITSESIRESPRVKDTGFISSSVAQRKLVGRDVFEVLLTKEGQIFEGMTSNFYAIKGRALVTAQKGILLGVTRRVVLRLARGQGMSIEYRAPHINEIFDEAFITSSSRGVVPVIFINEIPVGEGRVGRWAKTLSRAYQAYVEKRSEKIIK